VELALVIGANKAFGVMIVEAVFDREVGTFGGATREEIVRAK
jgi:hypothetical protein